MRPYVSFALAVGVVLALTTTPLPSQEKTDPIVGSYDWFNDAVVVIRANGSLTATSKKGGEVGGRWVVNPYGGYVVMWDGGMVESLKLTARSEKLAGNGVDRDGKSYVVTATKR